MHNARSECASGSLLMQTFRQQQQQKQQPLGLVSKKLSWRLPLIKSWRSFGDSYRWLPTLIGVVVFFSSQCRRGSTKLIISTPTRQTIFVYLLDDWLPVDFLAVELN